MTDCRLGTFCALHLVPFADCPCEERRGLIQIVCCDSCGKHFLDCACPVPALASRGAA